MRFLVLFLIIVTSATAAEQNVLYFDDPSKPGQHIPVGEQPITVKVGAMIDLQLEIKTASLEERSTFADLVVDDYRYDTPNYFEDHRAPNVSFEITTMEGKPVSFRVGSQGGGVNLQYLHESIFFEIGGNPKRLEEEMTQASRDMAAGTLKRENVVARLQTAQKYAPNQPGIYRVRAIYRPKVSGKWRGELSTVPITIVISNDR